MPLLCVVMLLMVLVKATPLAGVSWPWVMAVASPNNLYRCFVVDDFRVCNALRGAT